MFLSKLREYLEFDTVCFWSDGCASQFRSQYCFALLCLYDANLNITWHYFESNHGKGCIDGIGGTIKRLVYRDVLSNKVIITSASHFVEYVNPLTFINVLYLNASDIETFEISSQKVDKTLQVHCVRRIREKEKWELRIFRNSVTQICLTSLQYPFANDVMAITSNDSHINAPASSTDHANLTKTISVDSWVAVKCSDNNIYPGKVVQIKSVNEYMVSKLHPLNRGHFNYTYFQPISGDVTCYDNSSILGMLPKPMPTNRRNNNFSLDQTSWDMFRNL